MGYKDLPQTLVLLNEMNNSAQHVANLVDNMIQKVYKGELTTDQGLSFLEMKYNLLLSYLINLTYVVLRKCSGEMIEGDPCIDRLIQIRTILEKVKPVNSKLKYQIDKLVKSTVTGTDLEAHTNLKATINGFIGASGERHKDSSEEDINDDQGHYTNKVLKKTIADIYVPPKFSSVHYPGSFFILLL